ncbi:hypothetical protein M513_11320 [Trichuris suis]|uniref:Tr-type G domain-containing protein n=1 Tax=Trichuris suis TaxID=68888 RepID=A0A085LS24_9BILA|nr:hypothetical protein M513_11320 [Trichuris suis]
MRERLEQFPSALSSVPFPDSSNLSPSSRVAVVGNVDAGKSTLLSVLTHGQLDDGRGFARVRIFRHQHEVESGRTSSIGNDILGFDCKVYSNDSANETSLAISSSQSSPLLQLVSVKRSGANKSHYTGIPRTTRGYVPGMAAL